MKPFYALFAFYLFSSGLYAQIQSLSLLHDGINRTYELRLPAGYDANAEYPLVLVLHGLGGNGAMMITDPNLWAVMDNPLHPFIVVAPDALLDETVFGTYEWNEGLNPFNAIDDVGFISSLIDELQQNYSVNNQRVYCTGMSDGGFMTNRLACELNNKIAAFASVTGTMATSLNCNPGRPIALFHIHGTGDDVVSYYGEHLLGQPSLAPFMFSVDEIMDFWTNNADCYSEISATMLGTDTEVYKYIPCNQDVEVWHYKVLDGGHEWYISPSFNTTQHIWDFFNQFTLIVGLEEENELAQIQVYPNPVKDVLTIATSASGGFDWNLINVQGQHVKNGSSWNSNGELDCSDLPAGVYSLRVVTSGQKNITKMIVVEH
jgi:polyhydroxybutyrate depolymerase